MDTDFGIEENRIIGKKCVGIQRNVIMAACLKIKCGFIHFATLKGVS